MSRRRQVWAVSVVLAGLAACAAPSGLRPVPSPPLPTDVLPGGGGDRYPVEVVSAEARFAFAADGTVERTHTLRYRVRTLDELGPWAAVSATWAPWFQARPEVRHTG